MLGSASRSRSPALRESAAVYRRFSRTVLRAFPDHIKAVLKHTHSPAAAGLRVVGHVRAGAASMQGTHLNRPKVDAYARRRDFAFSDVLVPRQLPCKLRI